MVKALFHKQLLESFSWVFFDKKNNKMRDIKGIILYVLFYLFIFGVCGVFFFWFAQMNCSMLVGADKSWLFWCIFSLFATAMGVLGSVFNTFSAVYMAKDNDMLLSMPIPSRIILLSRLMGVYLLGLMYELIVMIPCGISWFLNTPFGIKNLFCLLVSTFIISIVILILSTILGWVVAVISAKVKYKNFTNIFLSISFIVLYYLVYFKMVDFLRNILLYTDAIENGLKSYVYPLYLIGIGTSGNVLALLGAMTITLIVMGLVYYVMDKSFIKISTTNKGVAKNVYKENKVNLGKKRTA